MTVIIGYRFNDKVLFAADSLFSRRFSRANKTGSIYNFKERIVLIRPSIAIATVGQEGLCEAAVTAIFNAISNPGRPKMSLNEVIACCRDHFYFLHEQFIKYNPEPSDFITFLLGGTDPETGKSILFSFDSRDRFQKSENLKWIVSGPAQEEMLAKNLMVNQMHNIEKLNDQGVLLLFADFIKTISGFSHAVNPNCYGIIAGNFPCKEVLID